MNSSPHITQTSWPCQNQQGATATLHCLSIKIMANLPKCTLIYITYHITILQVCNYSRPKFFALSNIHFPVVETCPSSIGWFPVLGTGALQPRAFHFSYSSGSENIWCRWSVGGRRWESIFCHFLSLASKKAHDFQRNILGAMILL